jgi:3-oxoacyl-[acyl-carrier protein] reductase
VSRTLVVSGGASGIGRAVAETFAAEGDDVVIVGRREAQLRQAAEEISARQPGTVVDRACDLRQPDDVAELARLLTLEHEVIDAIVNVAGSTSVVPTSGLREVDAAWEADFRANLMTAVLLTTALLGTLRRPGGRVIAVSSISALRGGAGSYSAAKAALHGWVYALAGELGAEGITVNAIAPGYTRDTEMFGGLLGERGHARRVAETLVGRAGLPVEIAAGIRYLASAEAAFVTGEILNVNGGAVFGR